VIKMAATAIGDIKALVFFPIVPVFLAIVYFLFWVAEALYIFSVTDEVVGNVDPLFLDGFKEAYPNRETTFVDLEFRDSFRGYALYHLFHLFWNVQFLFYFGYLICAGAIADWYFTKCDASGNKIVGFAQDELSHMPVMSSLLRVLRYHMGTVAITSLIIAIIQTIRAIVKYIEEKTTGPDPNYVQKAVFCCIQCCLKCAECCMDKINKNSLIWTAIWGDGFCVAACSSFALIWRNLARVAALHMVSSFIFFMGKVTVSLAVAGSFAWLFVSVDKYETELSSPVLPICITFAIAYTICSLFMLVFESAADTIFFCFLVDEEKNKASGSSMFASAELQELIGKHEGASEEQAAKKKRLESGGLENVPLNSVAPSLGN
jgi:choline transporter-like protein 2/4/5